MCHRLKQTDVFDNYNGEFFLINSHIPLYKESSYINHNPKKNDLIVFNSDTFHSVKPYYGNNDRIAIAWDAIYTF